MALSQTGSALARTNLSPFARCTLGLNRLFITITAYMTQGFTTNREMVSSFQALDFCDRSLTTNSVTTETQELNGTSMISLASHNSKREKREI